MQASAAGAGDELGVADAAPRRLENLGREMRAAPQSEGRRRPQRARRGRHEDPVRDAVEKQTAERYRRLPRIGWRAGEKQRALAEMRSEVADLALAAAGRVVGETMSDDRQRRLVDEFLRGSASGPAAGTNG